MHPLTAYLPLLFHALIPVTASPAHRQMLYSHTSDGPIFWIKEFGTKSTKLTSRENANARCIDGDSI